MARNVLPICRTGLLAALDVKLGNEPVCGIKGDQFLFEWGKIPKLLQIFMLASCKYGDPQASLLSLSRWQYSMWNKSALPPHYLLLGSISYTVVSLLTAS